MKNTFTAHCTPHPVLHHFVSDRYSTDNGNRQPFGLYSHPIHVAPNVPGVVTPNSTIAMINEFLDWAQTQQNVWIVTNLQLLEWVRNPVPISQLNDFAPLKCPVPQVNAQICDGIPANELGLVQSCSFSDFPFMTCVSAPRLSELRLPILTTLVQYGCPSVPPTPDEPNPDQAQPTDSSGLRIRSAYAGPAASSSLLTLFSQFLPTAAPHGGTRLPESVSAHPMIVLSTINRDPSAYVPTLSPSPPRS